MEYAEKRASCFLAVMRFPDKISRFSGPCEISV
jgi:hypothetical protein